MQNHLKDELHNVLSGKSKVRFGTIIQAIACYLNDGEKTSPDAEVQKHFKEQERKRLNLYISQHNLWIDTIDFSQYVQKMVRHCMLLYNKITFPSLRLQI